jgi:RHS repeat-associated protein
MSAQSVTSSSLLNGINNISSATALAFSNAGSNKGKQDDTPIATPSPNGVVLDSRIPKAPSISLPKSGGAVHGMGEKFNVDPNTGLGSCAIPIPVSAARGVEPALSLQYSSGGGNSIFGLGWSLSLPQIVRKTSKGLPRYADGSGPDSEDVFLMDGHEDLVPTFQRDAAGNIVLDTNGEPIISELEVDNYHVRRYMPRIESSFDRIERWQSVTDPHEIYWVTVSGQNQTAIYGRDEASRIMDPFDHHRIYTWMVCEAYDSHGNAMIFDYKQENSDNVDQGSACESNRSDLARTAARHIKRVRYGNRVPNRDIASWVAQPSSALPESSWCFSVVFDYGDHDADFPGVIESQPWLCRKDPLSTFRPGFDLRTYRLCRRVLIFHHFLQELGVESCLVRSTNLTYQEDDNATLLVGVKQVGYALDTAASSNTSQRYLQNSLPGVSFDYSSLPNDADLASIPAEVVVSSSTKGLPLYIDGKAHQWVDLNTEGLSGILFDHGNDWYYKRNTSASNITKVNGIDRAQPRFAPLALVDSKPSVSVSDNTSDRAHFADVAGEGKLDVVVNSSGCWGYFERSQELGCTWEAFRTFDAFSPLDLDDRNIKFIDLTGDGLPDILICADQVITWFPSLGRQGYGPPSTVTQLLSSDGGPTCVYADTEETLHLADMTGDGMVDLVRIRNQDICYWANIGYGRFGAQIQMDHAPCFDTDDTFDSRRVLLADLDGSGPADILYIQADGVDAWLNCSGNGFSPSKRIGTGLPIDNLTSVTTSDLLGNGTLCLVWSSPLPAATQSPLRYVDIFQGQKPRMLTRVANEVGAETRITYASSNKFYLEAEERGTPWKSKLPFPVHCVEQIESLDTISGTYYANRYSYSHGYFDPIEREFRGFGLTETWDTSKFQSEEGNESKSSSSNHSREWEVPPVHTKTWYHTGVYGENNAISTHMSDEYFETDSFSGALLDDVVPPAEDLEGETLREACRALRGNVLRTEVYAEDGSDKAQIPYLIEESSYEIKTLQGIQDANLHAVFMVHLREHVSFHCERSLSDPRIQHSLTLETDRFGNTLKSVDIAYGRLPGNISLSQPARQQQEDLVMSYIESDMTTLIDSGTDYLLPKPYEKRQYEVTGFTLPVGSRVFTLANFTTNHFAPLTNLQELPYESPALTAATLAKRCVAKSRTLFRKDDLTGFLPKGQVEPLDLPGVSYTQCFTQGLIDTIYKRTTGTNPGELMASSDPIWLSKDGTGCGFVDLDGDGNLWTPSGQCRYESNLGASASSELTAARSSFFTPRCYMDPLGKSTIVDYDSHVLFPTSVTDAVGSTTSAAIDYRVLSPSLRTDANGNREAVAYDLLALPSAVAKMGKTGENQGDSLLDFTHDVSEADLDVFSANPIGPIAARLLGTASTRTIYDYRWEPDGDGGTGARTPYFATISRTKHVSDVPPGESTPITINFSYMDGLYQAIQKKALDPLGPLSTSDTGNASDFATANPRWCTSGWIILNNKSQTVREYEPFFSATHKYTPSVLSGAAATNFYDPLGRRVANLHPNHAFEKTEFTPWMVVKFDANDNVLADPLNDPVIGPYLAKMDSGDFMPTWYSQRAQGQLGPEEKESALRTANHNNTPTRIHLDVLSRPIVSVEDNGSAGMLATSTKYDFQSHIMESTDAAGRVFMKALYNMAGEAVWRSTLDKGETWALPDVMEKVLTVWNSRGVRFKTSFDALRRPLESKVTNDAGVEFVHQKFIYGDTMSTPEVNNLRGQLCMVKDQSGISSIDKYDFKGNVTEGKRQLAKTYKTDIDWDREVSLEDEEFRSTMTYDALNRPVLANTPDGSAQYHEYDEAGRLRSLRINLRGTVSNEDVPSSWPATLQGVEYDAKGQAISVQYANGVTVKHKFDPVTSELRQTLATRNGTSLQDLRYTNDPVGNVTSVVDRAQQTLFFSNSRVDASSSFTYDAVYRLIEATGREDLSMAGAPTSVEPQGRTAQESPSDGSALSRYTEYFTYDEVGNILKLRHAGDNSSSPGWTRTYSYAEKSAMGGQASNRLSSTTVGSTTESYGYDGPAGIVGNMTRMPQLQLVDWTSLDQIRATARQRVGSDGATPETTYYVYDSNGERVRKVTEAFAPAGQVAKILKETIYVAGTQIFRQHGNAPDENSKVVLERQTLDVNALGSRVVLFESRTVGDDGSPALLTRYALADGSGSSRVELDENGQLLTYEEYAPYGYSTVRTGTSSALLLAPKRFRYSGKERDNESGLCYFGARYYAPWIGRWTSCDPAGLKDGPNAYEFVQSRPSSRVDPDGRWSADWKKVALGVAIGAVAIGALALTGGAALALMPAAATAAATALGASAATATTVGVVAGVVATGATDLAVAYGTYEAGKGVLKAAETVRDLRAEFNPKTGKDFTKEEATEAVTGVILDVGSAAVAFAGAQSYVKGRLPTITGGGGGGFGPRLAGATAGAGGGSGRLPSSALEPASPRPANVLQMAGKGPSGSAGPSAGGAASGGAAPRVKGSGSGVGSKSSEFSRAALQRIVDSTAGDVVKAVFHESWAALKQMGVQDWVIQGLQEATSLKQVYRWKGLMGQAIHQITELQIAADPVLSKAFKWVGDLPNQFPGMGGRPDIKGPGGQPIEVTTTKGVESHSERPGWSDVERAATKQLKVLYAKYPSLFPDWWWWK